MYICDMMYYYVIVLSSPHVYVFIGTLVFMMIAVKMHYLGNSNSTNCSQVGKLSSLHMLLDVRILIGVVAHV